MDRIASYRISRRSACVALAAAPLWLSGCITPEAKDKTTANKLPAQPASPAMANTQNLGNGQLVVAMSNRVALAPDTQRGGFPNPGIMGRIYLFKDRKTDGTGVPYIIDGGLIVDLYDHTPRPGQTEPKMLEEWRFGDDSLRKFVKKDFVGEGYSIFMPWATYSSDVTQVLFQCRFISTDGKTSLFAQTNIISLDHQAIKEFEANKRRSVIPEFKPVQQ